MRSNDCLLDPTSETTLTNDLIISAASISIKNGSFIQTNSDNGVFNYSSRNTFLQAEQVGDYGPAYTGSKGFCILSVNPDSKILKLSGDLSSLESFHKSNPQQKYSILLESSAAEPYCTTITKIEG